MDSDAYPGKDWLLNAMKHFSDPEIAAVGGPGITPDEDSLMQKASGHILSSFMVGNLSGRCKKETARYSDDIHSCNFIARKTIVEKIKWNEKYWPGEDTLMCLGITRLGKRMIEAPDVVVHHHRRRLFLGHLRQISQFGLHRGFFAKKNLETSLKLTYFIPSFLILFLVSGSLISYIIPEFGIVFMSILSIYLILALVSSITSANPGMIILVWIGIILTHLTYGIYFLVGLSRRDLKR